MPKADNLNNKNVKKIEKFKLIEKEYSRRVAEYKKCSTVLLEEFINKIDAQNIKNKRENL